MSQICIMYPNNSTSVILGHHLASELHHVAYFVPEQGPHQAAAFTCVDEVMIASSGLDTTAKKLLIVRQSTITTTLFSRFSMLILENHGSH